MSTGVGSPSRTHFPVATRLDSRPVAPHSRPLRRRRSRSLCRNSPSVLLSLARRNLSAFPTVSCISRCLRRRCIVCRDPIRDELVGLVLRNSLFFFFKNSSTSIAALFLTNKARPPLHFNFFFSPQKASMAKRLTGGRKR